MRINNNLMAMNAHRYMTQSANKQSKSLEKLSSGLRINSAADDAAGLAISEKMRSQINGLEQASSNAQDGISMIQTAEGALQETHDILQRMRELSVQAANDTLESTDRESISAEIEALETEINRIADNTEFNGKSILSGTLTGTLTSATNEVGDAVIAGITVSKIDVSSAKAQTYTFTASGSTVTLTGGTDNLGETITISDMDAGAGLNATQTLDFASLGIKIDIVSDGTGDAGADIAAALATDQVVVGGSGSASLLIGANAGQTMTVSFDNMRADNAAGLNLETAIDDFVAAENSTTAGALVTALDTAIEFVNTQRSSFGAAQNRLEHTINNLSTTSENLTASESRIRDVDMAKEMMEYTKLGILQQASQAMLAQANQAPQGVLQLLR